MTKTVLFWDIDGTLLTTARAGIFAWEEALEHETGTYHDLSQFDTPGKTDIEIARDLSRLWGDGTELQKDRLVIRYEIALPGALPRKNGYVLDGALAALQHFRATEGVESFLLTGNTRRGALAKIGYYGLLDLVSEGAFGDDALDRPGVAEVAMDVAERHLGFRPAPGRTFVIGDTPKDVACGNWIGVRTVGVASGSYSAKELSLAGAWIVLDKLPTPESLARDLGIETPEASNEPS